jgi:uncharacterized membrane protein (UPF0127 family)
VARDDTAPTTRRLLAFTLWLGAALTLPACRSRPPAAAGGGGETTNLSQPAIPSTAQPALSKPTVLLEAGGRKVPFHVELATTEADREKGLKMLTRPTGILFVFPREAPQTVSTKNTSIPVDIIFIGSDRRIVGIVENAAPETEVSRHVNGPSQYALEISGGLSSKLGFKVGSQVEFKGMPPALLAESGVGRPG